MLAVTPESNRWLEGNKRLAANNAAISALGTCRWTLPDGTEMDRAILPNDGFAVLQRRPGGRWRLVRARGDYWRYVNYAEDTPEGRRIHTADALGEPERLSDGIFVWPEHTAPPS